LAKARVLVKEVKRFLVADSLEEFHEKLDRYYMVFDFEKLTFRF